ncbi:MAG: BatA domain-containing protein [Candidatus Korobacteraceae bacterium]
MGFLSPWFLAGMAALGLPIYLHLLQKHRTVPLRFSSLMMFERRTQSSVKHRRLRYLLLFAMRMLLLLLLVLAFANPFVMRAVPPGNVGQRIQVLAIDHSFSMRALNGTTSSLDQAKQQALQVAGALGSDRAQVLALDNQVRLLTQSTQEQRELRSAIESIQPGDSRSSYGELTRAVRSIAQSSRAPVILHLFSDMQKTSMPPAFSDLRLMPGVELVLHSVASERGSNFAVEQVSAPRRVSDTSKARVQATIAGFAAPDGARTVSLVLNGKTVGTKTVEVPENGRATAEFIGLDAAYGLNRGEVRIDAADSLTEDDRFFFGVERTDPKKVLFIHEARQGRAVLYVRNAVEASADAAFSLEPVTVEQVGNVDPTRFAAVVVSDVASLPAGFVKSLETYVRQGGAVLFAMGPTAGTRSRVPLFDEAIVASNYASRAGDRFQMATETDASHPAIARANRWEGVKFYHTVKVEPGSAAVFARLADGTPLLMEKKLGEGRVMVFASTLDNISNDFPLHASFVPFIEQTAYYLSGEEDRRANVPVDSHVDLRNSKDLKTAVEVLGPDGQRALSLQEAASAESVPVDRAGFYELRRANGRHELVAVNPDRLESNLERIPQETLDLWVRTGQAGSVQEGQPGQEQSQNRWPLWWYVLLAVAVLGVAESVIASRHLAPPDRPEDGGSLGAGKESKGLFAGAR